MKTKMQIVEVTAKRAQLKVKVVPGKKVDTSKVTNNIIAKRTLSGVRK
jgi:hypothetical protein